MRSVAAVIPARYGSTRFPGKVLADRTGRPLVQHVWERLRLCRSVGRVIVATDDHRVRRAVESFGGEAVMTRADHPNGTCRIAEVAAKLTEPIIVNVQADEPEIDPDHIDAAVAALRADRGAVVSTLAAPFADGEDPASPHIVKVVRDLAGRALYFSRALIPHDRDGAGAAAPLKHVGLYVYRREFLLEYPALRQTPLEAAECLEQLRILEHGRAIAVALVERSSHGIDTPEQYEAFVKKVSG